VRSIERLIQCTECPNEVYLSSADALAWHRERFHAAEPRMDTVPDIDEFEAVLSTTTDDKAEALQAAATVLAPLIGNPATWASQVFCGPWPSAAPNPIAGAVTGLADLFVAWLRRLETISLEWVAIENEATGEVIAPHSGGNMALILTGQRARAVITAADSRGFPVDATLAVKVTDAAGSASTVATAEIVEATSGTASGKDELVVHVGDQAGSALVTVYAPDRPDTVFGSLAVDVAGNPDDVAHIDLSEAVIEDEPPVTEPGTGEPTPAPETPGGGL
jgi:hypothetical protein